MVQVVLMGSLKGHSKWVTSIATTDNPDILLSVSRDKSLIIWKLTRDEISFGEPYKRLHGHGSFIQDFAVSQDGQFAITASWDKTLRLWDLNTGTQTKVFKGHTNDVMSVAFSPDNRQIISCSRDRTIKIWNTLGECKYTIQNESHTSWISMVRASPNPETPVFVTCGWDKHIKVWNLSNFRLRSNHIGHRGNINTVAISPDGSLCASGGKDGITMLWDLSEGKFLYSLEAGNTINNMTFSPTRFWLCAATASSIRIWDLESKKVVCELKPQFNIGKRAREPECISLAWSVDGSYLFSGYTDGLIRVWAVRD